MEINTFSIVAFDAETQAWGVAVASKFLAVGSVVPWARARAGAVATQAWANTTYGPHGLSLMAQGASAEAALQQLLAEDKTPHVRQVGLVDRQGHAAQFTGESCKPWAGGIIGPGFAIQGNFLAGKIVVEAMAEKYTESSGWFPERLYAALLAGDRAGGDQRGRQSAALLVVKENGGYGGFNDRWIDYRVDNHPDPIPLLGELLSLHIVHNETGPPEDRVALIGEPLRKLQNLMKHRGIYNGEAHGRYDHPTQAALDELVRRENVRDRTDIAKGYMDQIALDFLLRDDKR